MDGFSTSTLTEIYCTKPFGKSLIYPPNWESTCTFEIGKIAHAFGMSASDEDARGGEYKRGGGIWRASPRKILKFRMQESASETIFQ